MDNLNMVGPNKIEDIQKIKDLDIRMIDVYIQSDKEKGNYAFGNIDKNGNFVPIYIGRSTTNLKQEIINRLKEKQSEGYSFTHFKYQVRVNDKEIYNEECRNYHDNIKTLKGNIIHPAKLEGFTKENLPCPYCKE